MHPKDVQDGKIAIGRRDILTNLPYVPEALLVFDHHSSEALRNGTPRPNHVICRSRRRPRPGSSSTTSAGPSTSRRSSAELMAAVDQADSAQFSLDDILQPTGWTLLNFLMDSRTGLGRFRTFRISNYELMMLLIEQVPGPDRRAGPRAAGRGRAGRPVLVGAGARSSPSCGAARA